jgi:hypothetical protein
MNTVGIATDPGAQQAGVAQATQPADEPVPSIGQFGGTEGIVARAIAKLEEQQQRIQQTQRDVRSAQRQSERQQIAEQRSASKWALAAGIVQGAATAAAGAMGVAGSGQSGASGAASQGTWAGRAEITEAAGQLGHSALNFGAQSRQHAATRQQQIAGHHRDGLEELDDSEQRLERLTDKATSHLERIAEARMQAQLTASRGW